MVTYSELFMFVFRADIESAPAKTQSKSPSPELDEGRKLFGFSFEHIQSLNEKLSSFKPR